MCDLMTAGMTLMGVGAVTGAYGQLQQGKTQAKLANLQASQQEEAGKAAASRIRDDATRLLGSQNVAVAKSGTTMAGSNLDVIMDSATRAELDARQAEVNGQVQAQASRLSGQYAKYQSRWNALGSMIGAGSNMLMMQGSWGGGSSAGAPWGTSANTATGRPGGPV